MSEETQIKTFTSKNGTIHDKRTGRIIANPSLTPDKARDMVRAREEKRMRLYAEGAGLATVDQSLIKKYGTDAHIVERARTMQEIATTPDAGKAAVMAAQHLDKAQGLISDGKADAETNGNDPVTRTLVQLLSAMTDAVRRDNVDVVEAQATEAGEG